MYSPEKIAEKTDHLEGIANIKAINKLYRQQDESHLYPVCRRFDATDRAIRQARTFQRSNGAVYGYEYALLIDNLLSRIVSLA